MFLRRFRAAAMRDRSIALLLASAVAMPAAPHVIVVSVAGINASGLDSAKNPNIAALMSSSAWTLNARAAANWPSVSPNIFLLQRQQKPSSDIAIFREDGTSAADTMRRAIAYLDAHNPDLLSIALDSTDVDPLIGQLTAALDRRKILLLTGADLWIISGPGVRPGEIKAPVNEFDTAATIAYLLDLRPPPSWTGRVVSEALRARATVRGLPEAGQRPPPSTIRMK
jgi:hypothetical protein